MKMYLWDYIRHCTDNYHSEGGVVVFANSQDEARIKFKEYATKVFSNSWSKAECYIEDDELPELILTITGAEPLDKDVYIFPNAGCC